MSTRKQRKSTFRNSLEEKENVFGTRSSNAQLEQAAEQSESEVDDEGNGNFPESSAKKENDEVIPPRRSSRVRTPSKRTEFLNKFGSSQKSGRKSKNTTDDMKHNSNASNDGQDVHSDDGGETSVNLHVQINRVFEDYDDVAGGEIYKFRTPKKRDGMAHLAATTPRTPNTPKMSKVLKTPTSDFKSLSLNTPKSGRGGRGGDEINAQSLKTPSQTRQRLRQALKKQTTYEEESDVTDDEDADYAPASSDESEEAMNTEEDSISENSTKSDEEHAETEGFRHRNRMIRNIKMFEKPEDDVPVLSARPTTRSHRKSLQQKDYLPESDKYFNQISSKKARTSDHTLDRLKSSRLQHEDLFEILRTIKLSEEHRIKTSELIQEHHAHFSKWILLLSKGFNIILYGLGSKQRILQQFCELELADRPFIVVNGFFPSLTVKEILHSIRTDILKLNLNGRTDHEIVDDIADAFRSAPNTHLFLVIHSIDGPMLRKTKDQHLLSRLAKIRNVHLLSSIDHINAPLMWDQTCMSNYNFLWWDCTTLLPYTNETAFENSVFLQNSGELGLAAMNNVFQSLTSNARGIYMLMVDNQLKNKKDSNYQGISMKDLYHGCRDKFLVSSDLALRTQLTEFVDHNMAKMKRSIDGTEYLTIPIDQYILHQFVEQQKE